MLEPDNIDKTLIIPQSIADAVPEKDTRPIGSRKSRFRFTTRRLFVRKTVVEDSLHVPSESKKKHLERNNHLQKDHLPVISEQYQVSSTPFAGGGQGNISKAVNIALGNEVAVKSLHTKLCSDENARTAFFNEAKLTAQLDHPGIIPIHGLYCDPEDGMHLAMKLISGKTLADYLREIAEIYESRGVANFNEHKSLRNRIDIFLRVCEAVDYAHDRHILHRDLKPENIMIGPHRETYVTDWGIAMHIDEARNLTKLTGTPGYVAPEVLTQKSADVRTDVYALGLILFELVTLSPAFPGEKLTEMVRRIKRGWHAPLRHRFHCRIDTDLAAIIRKAISTDPEKRYSSAAALAEDLRSYLDNAETIANPDNLFSKLGRQCVKHHKGMLLIALSALLLAAGSVAVTLQKQIDWSITNRYRDHAASAVYTNLNNTAEKISRTVEQAENLLARMRLNMLFSALETETPYSAEKNCFVPREQYRSDKAPKSYMYYPARHQKADPDNVCVFNFRKKPLDPQLLRSYGNTANFMAKIPALFDRDLSAKEAKQQFMEAGSPIKRIYFALEAGIFACYPGMDDFPDTYDPLKRRWYTEGKKQKDLPVWISVYQDGGTNQDLVSSCAIPIRTAAGKLAGVAGVDFSITQLAEQLFEHTTDFSRFTHAKALFSRDGKVLYRTSGNSGEADRVFSSPDLILRMQQRKNGKLHFFDRFGKEKLLVFAFIKKLNIFYAEYIDFDALIQYQRSCIDL